MKLNEVRRSTRKPAVVRAIRAAGACSIPVWLARQPASATAQQLWNRCPDDDDLAWLVQKIAEQDEHAGIAEAESYSWEVVDVWIDWWQGYGAEFGGPCARKTCNRIRAEYESPWLP